MKALSIRQPWAWLYLGPKPVENRNWPTKFRGRCLIHASASKAEMTKEVLASVLRLLETKDAAEFMFAYKHLSFGTIIGEVDIVDCKFRFSEENDDLYSPWHEKGMYGFIRENPVRYDMPVICSGQLGFFEPHISFPANALLNQINHPVS